MTTCKLTDEQIDALDLRGLDAVVAEHVMGWTDLHDERHGEERLWFGKPPRVACDCVNVPAYSTDHEAADAMEEQLAATGRYRAYRIAREGLLEAEQVARCLPVHCCRAALRACREATPCP